MSASFKATLGVFTNQLVALCTEYSIGLEDWEVRHASIRAAEHGKCEAKQGKSGIVRIGKGAKASRWSDGMSASYGEFPHASLRFQRECDCASAYVAEFKGAHIGITEASATYCRRVAEDVAAALVPEADELVPETVAS